MALKLRMLLMMAALCTISFSSFTFLYSMNGSNPDDNTDYFRFSQPTGLLFANGKLYVTDSGRDALYVMNGTLRQKMITGQESGNELVNPLKMTYENGTIYIADGISGKIKQYRDDGTPIDSWTFGETNLAKPSGIVFNGSNAYITDLNKGNLYIYSRAGRAYVSTGLIRGGSDGQLSEPEDIIIYANQMFISDSGKQLIYAYGLDLALHSTIGRRGGVILTSPRGFEIYQDRIYVADSTSHRIVVYSMDGYPIDILDANSGGNFSYPEDVAISNGKLYVAESGGRMVKVFSINATSGNETVAWTIAAARNSLSNLMALQQVAEKIGVSYSSDMVVRDIESAQEYYDQYLFSTASNLAQKALDESFALQKDLSQKLDIGIKKIAKDSQNSVSPYRAGAKGAIEAKIVQLDNMATDVDAKVSAKMYSAAADASLSMQELAKEIVSVSMNASAMEEQIQKNITASLFSLQANSLEAKLARIEAKASAYRQQIDTSNARSLIDASIEHAREGDYDAANRSLTLVALELNLFDDSINKNTAEIDIALANITKIEAEFGSIAAKPTLVPAGIEGDRKKMEQAKEMAYLNPALAVITAQQASDSALAKMAEAQALSTSLAAFLMIVGLTTLLAIVFYIHIKKRKGRKKSDGCGNPKQH